MSSIPRIRPDIDFHESEPSAIAGVFSAAYSPMNTAIVSLMNLPTKNAGIIKYGFIFAIPPAMNNGVVGSGSSEYVRIAS